MARIDLYLSDDEKQWVGTQKRGFVRGLVRQAMGASGRVQMLTRNEDRAIQLDAQPGRPMAISPSQYAKKKEAP